jgi:predicted outer membrane protein
MRQSSLGLAILFSAGMTGVGPAHSESIATQAFKDNVRLAATFMLEASGVAMDRAQDADLRAFARRQVADQLKVFYGLGMPAPLPLIAENENEPTLVGRSAAISNDIVRSDYAAFYGKTVILPATSVSLDKLKTLTGTAFDDAYVQAMQEAWGRAQPFFEAYANTGDDTDLRALSATETEAAQSALTFLSTQ